MRQRPDIRAAEERLEAQIARTKEARAELKPRFTLDGFLGLITLGGGNLFGSGAHSFAIPHFHVPLLASVRLAHQVLRPDVRHPSVPIRMPGPRNIKRSMKIRY